MPSHPDWFKPPPQRSATKPDATEIANLDDAGSGTVVVVVEVVVVVGASVVVVVSGTVVVVDVVEVVVVDEVDVGEVVEVVDVEDDVVVDGGSNSIRAVSPATVPSCPVALTETTAEATAAS